MNQKASRVGYYILCGITGTLVFLVFMFVADLNNDSRGQLDAMVDGSAYRPYVYRQLVPFTARLLSAAIPDSIETGFEKDLAQTYSINHLFTLYHIPQSYYFESVIIIFIMYVSILAVIVALHALIKSQFQSHSMFSDLTPLLVILGLIPTFTVGKIYDLTAVLFFVLGLLCMVKLKWQAYFVLFTLACFNKETTLILIVIFATHFYLTQKLPRRVFWQFLVLQSIIWVMVRASLMVIFRNNPGGSVEIHFTDHVNEYARIAGLYPLTCVILSIVFFLVIPFVIFYRWNEYPRFLLHANIGWPLIMVLYLLIGNPFEFRVFQESLTLILMLGVYHYMTWRGIPIRAYESIGQSTPKEIGAS